jgi:uncharacterized membrane protein
MLRFVLVTAYCFAGIEHLRSPELFLPIVPGWMPFPHETVLLTGLAEVAGALALLTTRLRKLAAIMLAAYAVCVFPANIKHAFEGVVIGETALTWWYHAPRLALQPIFVWWPLFAGSLIDWPFGDAD